MCFPVFHWPLSSCTYIRNLWLGWDGWVPARVSLLVRYPPFPTPRKNFYFWRGIQPPPLVRAILLGLFTFMFCQFAPLVVHILCGQSVAKLSVGCVSPRNAMQSSFSTVLKCGRPPCPHASYHVEYVHLDAFFDVACWKHRDNLAKLCFTRNIPTCHTCQGCGRQLY